MSATATKCTQPGCNNPTLDPSGRCHHHQKSLAPQASSTLPVAPPAATRSVARELNPEELKFFKAMRMRIVAGSSPTATPYIAAALYKLKPYSVDGTGTFSVDDYYRVYMDMSWAMEMAELAGMDYPVGCLVHEAWHPLRGHGQRYQNNIGGGSANHEKWNWAADMEINDDIIGIVPDDSVFPATLQLEDGKTAEWYYERIPSKDGDSSKSEGDKDNGNGEPQHTCGGGSGVGSPREYELGPDGGVTQAEQKVIQMQVAQDITDYAKSNPGKVPAETLRWAASLQEGSPVDWRRALRSSIRQSIHIVRGRKDISYRRRNRRQDMNSVILPGWMSPTVEVAIAIDTSGSMDPTDLAIAQREVAAVLKQSNVDSVRTFSVDRTAKSVPKQMRKGQAVDLTGGGGTDMEVALKTFGGMKKNRPNVGIILTDGDTPWGTYRPNNMHVIICVIGKNGGTSRSYGETLPEWAKVIYVDQDSATR